MSKIVTIDGRAIGEGHAPYIVAELSANHQGNLQIALDTISMAKAQGADAVKLQTYEADTITLNSTLDDFMIFEGPWAGESLYSLYEKAQTPFAWHKPLFEHARKVGITAFSTPFDETAVDLLEDLNAPAYKIASFELIDLPLIAYVAATKKPMVMSTGMANLDEIAEAVATARDSGCQELILLHCISGYPTPAEQANLRTIRDLADRFQVVGGLSDHTLGTAVSVASIGMGASFIEKHFILDPALGGPDAAFSITPSQLKQLCDDCRTAFVAQGQVNYQLLGAEAQNLRFRRSIYVAKDVAAGEVFTTDNIRRVRPGFGLAPKHYSELLGKTATKDLKAGTAMCWDFVAK